MVCVQIVKELVGLGTPARAEGSMRFFKTAKGQYGAGDIFLGVSVPETRKIVKKYLKEVTPRDIEKLLESKYHEARLAACLLMVQLYTNHKKEIFEMYVKNTGVDKAISNWDLIDSSAEHLVGGYISTEMEHEERKEFIDKSIASPDLWVNRMIVLASFYQIKSKNEKLILYIAPKFMDHKHDLIHKAVGWMLREMGKKVDRKYLLEFLDQYSKKMPRTMLRYSIEHLPVEQRKMYMER